MTTTQTNELTSRKPLRLWPGVAIAIAQLLIMFGAPIVAPEAELPVGMFGGLVGALAIAVWWVLFSRARWSERVGAIVLMVLGVLAMRQIAHESIVGAGQGNLVYLVAVPYLSFALVAWAVLTRSLQDGVRRTLMVAAILLAVTPFALMRTAGIKGGAGSEFHWRWTPTPEQRLLAQAGEEPKTLPPAPAAVAATPKEPLEPAPSGAVAVKSADKPAALPAVPATAKTEPAATAVAETPAEWPGFRGPNRDDIIHGVRIATDWSASPPVELWRRPIGPGWSSFAVHGDLIYTQEQRGEQEMVASYRLSTGEPVWKHRDSVRFYESNGGAGPRATPTLSHGRVYAFGATGILNALDERNGAVLWSRNVAAETKTKTQTPGWGFSASPLVVDDVVIIAASGTLAAYDRVTGDLRWVNPSRGGSYSSPHLATIDGVRQVLLLAGPGVMSVAPADGALLWEHKWDGGAIVQPAVTADGDVVINAISMMGGVGTRRLAIAHGSGGWSVEERWTSNGLKPYYNDFVVHNGHAFGFDGSILACIDLADGKRKWKGGRFGNGQLVLLPDQDVLLVLSEDGELALVSATTEKFAELARFPALNSKTWNHPVLVGDVLLVRNGEEMVAFRLSLAGS
jgi:outer membrane protein assembly factor BamB